MAELNSRISDSECQYLEWDSTFFGKKIAQCLNTSLTEDRLHRIRQWCAYAAIDCLYFLADSSDEATLRLAHSSGFQLVDIRITLDRKLNLHERSQSLSRGHHIRPSVSEDVPALSAIAGCSHKDSRFYVDSHFPSELCDRLFSTWIERSCAGYADIVLVEHDASQPTGYVTCHLQKDGNGSIGLFGVAADHRGRGIGTALIDSALAWFSEQAVNRVTVVTQGRNISAQRLYQQCGFRTTSVELWYHLWFNRVLGEAHE